MTALFSAENHKIGALAESRGTYACYSHIQTEKAVWLMLIIPTFRKSRAAYALMHQFFHLK